MRDGDLEAFEHEGVAGGVAQPHPRQRARGPDGLVEDARGYLYVAGGRDKPRPPNETKEFYGGGIYVFNPRGEFIDFVAIPNDEVTNCTFGGDDLKTLFITAGGTLWSIETLR